MPQLVVAKAVSSAAFDYWYGSVGQNLSKKCSGFWCVTVFNAATTESV
jgi:hypothetical protein